MLFVVFGHALQTVMRGSPDDSLQLAIRLFQMPALFLISGWFAPQNAIKPLRKDIYQKTLRLLVPTVCWIYLWYALRVVMGIESFSFRGLTSNFLSSGFWFLRELFVIAVVHAILIRLIPPMYTGGGILAIGLCIYAISGWRIEFGLTSIAYYITFYELGFLTHFLKNKYIISTELIDKWFVQIIAAIVLFGSIILYIFMNVKPSGIIRWLCGLGISASVISLGRLLYFNGPRWVIHLCDQTGKNSLAIYAVHWNLLFVPLSCYLVKWLPVVTSGIRYTFAFLTFAIWIGLTFAIIHIVRKCQFLSIVLFGDKWTKNETNKA